MGNTVSNTSNYDKTYKPCSIKLLPEDLWIEAAKAAVTINPTNAPAVHQFRTGFPGAVLPPAHLALLTTKRWGAAGVSLTVGFLDPASPELRARIISHMNAWSDYCDVSFTETDTDPQVRIKFTEGDGYWSYLGTDITQIEPDQPTMNLDSFSMDTPESEYHQVVRHETGHTLGFPHEHMRSEIADNIDPEKAMDYFGATQGWSRQEVTDQVLTSLETSALITTEHADENSIMCYGLPGFIMKDNAPVPGGVDIDDQDAKFAGLVYPKTGNA